MKNNLGDYTDIGEWTHHIDLSCGHCGSGQVALIEPDIKVGLISWGLTCTSCNKDTLIRFIIDRENIDIRPHKIELLLKGNS